MEHHVQTKKEIERVLAGLGVRPRKRFGQHFLVDGNLMRRLVKAAAIGSEDLLLEVGPGTGGLTDLLVHHGEPVVAVEIDRDLALWLRERFAGCPHFQLIEGDVLHRKHELNDELVAVLRDPAVEAKRLKLVANLPYQVATPLIMNLLVDYRNVDRLCFTVQREVGQRITAAPGSRDYGPISILAQLLSDVEVIAKLPPHVFWPRPSVDSAMLRMQVQPPPFSDRPRVAALANLVRRTFEHRRKKLRSALSYAIGDEPVREIEPDFDLDRRPEAVPPREWVDLFESVEPWLERKVAVDDRSLDD